MRRWMRWLGVRVEAMDCCCRLAAAAMRWTRSAVLAASRSGSSMVLSVRPQCWGRTASLRWRDRVGRILVSTRRSTSCSTANSSCTTRMIRTAGSSTIPSRPMAFGLENRSAPISAPVLGSCCTPWGPAPAAGTCCSRRTVRICSRQNVARRDISCRSNACSTGNVAVCDFSARTKCVARGNPWRRGLGGSSRWGRRGVWKPAGVRPRAGCWVPPVRNTARGRGLRFAIRCGDGASGSQYGAGTGPPVSCTAL